MVEEQTTRMMLTIATKSLHHTTAITAKTARGAVKLAAYLKGLWNRLPESGRVALVDVLKNGGSITNVAFTKAQFEAFEKIARDHNIVYAVEYRADMEGYLVTMRADDLTRFDTVEKFRSQEAPKAESVKTEAPISEVDPIKADILKSTNTVDFTEYREGRGVPLEKCHVVMTSDSPVIEEAIRGAKREDLKEARVVGTLRQEKMKNLSEAKTRRKVPVREKTASKGRGR